MVKLVLNNASFVTSAVKQSQYPTLKSPRGKLLPEIAVAGRSNVGKSTLINHLLGAKGLAKTSSTPGKTQLINFFLVNEELILTDLPGYGYAKVPVKTRAEWGPMVQTYLDNRESLGVILFLFDIRRTPTEEDLQFIDWVESAQKKWILVLTKLDKVTRNEAAARSRQLSQIFSHPTLQALVHYSAPKNIGRRELTVAIQQALETLEE